ncbi:probable E3 ubiquitin-protein ligase BAH1-like 1 [Zingiber officinale]|uniref:probable E3 ubiquitin-protein ligase BAH1-like 1 n=1 Tax=Zingiber officinale TaxID=94328 RepID=UPI001C4DC7AC|nr:probable E3 ubiquitin-protein ligase BAH1-like 1 [Zingiber officinale]
MKFGQTFTEYLHGEQKAFLNKCSHVEYKRLKKVLKSCRICRSLSDDGGAINVSKQREDNELPTEDDQCDSCASCNQRFFTELTKEASEIAVCFSSRVRRLLNLHISSGLYRCVWRLRHCFADDQQVMIQEGRMLLDYVTMNAIAINKILKKYDKVHGSVDGRNFKTMMRAKQIELLQSPWLIELGAFYLNFRGSDMGEPGEFFNKVSCDLSDTQPVMTMTLLNSKKYEYSLICPICLDIVFNPYALGCGHLFCKGCACSAASVLLFQGLKEAPKSAKCPVCRAVGMYKDAVHMTELDLLFKNRCKKYWKERLRSERSEMVKQAKEYWERQAISAVGI